MSNDTNLYKRRYYIVFYDSHDEYLVASFKNIQQVCVYKMGVVNECNINLTRVELCRALKRKNNATRMLDGSLMHVHLIDVEE